jgi:polyhydroxybutyrate depolymerase
MRRSTFVCEVCILVVAGCSPASGGATTGASPTQGVASLGAGHGPALVAGSSASTTATGATTMAIGSAGSSSVALATAGSTASMTRDAGRGASAGSVARAMGNAGRAAAQAGQPAAGSGMLLPLGGPDPGGIPIANPAPKPSAGCGKPAPMAGNASIDVMGTSRDYIVALPQNYDPNKPYKLIYAWHGLGGSAMGVAATWYGLKNMSQNGAIFVAGQGLQTMSSVGNGAGWPNTNGQDVAFVKALHAQLQGQLCFDENRVFSVGMSYGGIMSHTLGCQMGDVFRAIAPMSGSGPLARTACVGQVAVWMSHGDMDTTVPTASGEMSRDFWVKANHCQMTSTMVDPSPCLEYMGCDADSPVTFCKFAGGHVVPPFAAAAIWKFFSQF